MLNFWHDTLYFEVKQGSVLWGYSVKKPRLSMRHAHLRVDLLFLENTLLISFNSLYGSRFIQGRLRKMISKCNHSVPQIITYGTHTHGSIKINRRQDELGSENKQVLSNLVDELYKLYVRNMENQRHSKVKLIPFDVLGRNYITSRRLCYKNTVLMKPNRREVIHEEIKGFLFRSNILKDVYIIKLPFHNNTLGIKNTHSGDFYFEVQNLMERELDAKVIILPGFSGDLKLDTAHFNVVMRTKSILNKFPTFSPRNLRDYARKFYSGLHFNYFEGSNISQVTPTNFFLKLNKKQVMGINLLQIDKFRLGFVEAEVSNRFCRFLDSRYDLFTGCAGDTFGYFSDTAQRCEGGYEVTGFQEAFCFGGFDNYEYTERRLVDVLSG